MVVVVLNTQGERVAGDLFGMALDWIGCGGRRLKGPGWLVAMRFMYTAKTSLIFRVFEAFECLKEWKQRGEDDLRWALGKMVTIPSIHSKAIL